MTFCMSLADLDQKIQGFTQKRLHTKTPDIRKRAKITLWPYIYYKRWSHQTKSLQQQTIS